MLAWLGDAAALGELKEIGIMKPGTRVAILKAARAPAAAVKTEPKYGRKPVVEFSNPLADPSASLVI